MKLTFRVKLNGVYTEVEVTTEAIIASIAEHIPSLPDGAYYDRAAEGVFYNRCVTIMGDDGYPKGIRRDAVKCEGLSDDDIQLLKKLDEISDMLSYK